MSDKTNELAPSAQLPTQLPGTIAPSCWHPCVAWVHPEPPSVARGLVLPGGWFCTGCGEPFEPKQLRAQHAKKEVPSVIPGEREKEELRGKLGALRAQHNALLEFVTVGDHKYECERWTRYKHFMLDTTAACTCGLDALLGDGVASSERETPKEGTP